LRGNIERHFELKHFDGRRTILLEEKKLNMGLFGKVTEFQNKGV
jgi:hypothetical protein